MVRTFDSFDLRDILVHELGHAFGLKDTALKSGGGKAPDQPYSKMSAEFSAIQDDDFMGMANLFGAFWGEPAPFDDWKSLSVKHKLIRLTTRIGGTINDACLGHQHNHVMAAIESFAASNPV